MHELENEVILEPAAPPPAEKNVSIPSDSEEHDSEDEKIITRRASLKIKGANKKPLPIGKGSKFRRK